jgi:large subunit ribosomal protein L1
VGNAVKELKAGKVSYRVDKGANIHVAVGKLSFQMPQLEENVKTLIDSILRAKPAVSKGEYVKSVSLSGSMSPGISVSKASIRS